MKSITITVNEKDECALSFDGDAMTWSDACLTLCSALGFLAEKTVKQVSAQLKKDNPKASAKDIQTAVKGDVADQINFAVSNILNKLAPKDPDLQLSEVAIATCENIIIQYASANKLTIKDALAQAEQILAESMYAAKERKKLVVLAPEQE